MASSSSSVVELVVVNSDDEAQDPFWSLEEIRNRQELTFSKLHFVTDSCPASQSPGPRLPSSDTVSSVADSQLSLAVRVGSPIPTEPEPDDSGSDSEPDA